jgi:5-methylcytosine-specific restriction endonuclease McrA
MAKKRGRKPYQRRQLPRDNKPIRPINRDYLDPAYVKWRDDIKKRDKYQCQWPGCGCKSRRNLQVHHIKTWSQHAGLRFVQANGITLCRQCHEKIKGREVDYEAFLLKILEWQML